MYKFIKSERGSNILINDGYMYHLEKKGVQKTIWRCVTYKKKCRGRVHIVGELCNGNLFKIMDHNHVPDIAQIEVKTAVNEMKINAKCTSNSTHAVIGTLASQVINTFYTHAYIIL